MSLFFVTLLSNTAVHENTTNKFTVILFEKLHSSKTENWKAPVLSIFHLNSFDTTVGQCITVNGVNGDEKLATANSRYNFVYDLVGSLTNQCDKYNINCYHNKLRQKIVVEIRGVTNSTEIPYCLKYALDLWSATYVFSKMSVIRVRSNEKHLLRVFCTDYEISFRFILKTTIFET